jgi:hypothetical protein
MRTLHQAKDFAVGQHENPSQDWFQNCQVFARQCVGAAPFGKSARLAFNGTPDEHRHRTFPPPAGSIAYYGDLNEGFGHAVFVVDGGWVWSTDILRHGKVDKVRWDVFETKWHMPYRGWIDWCPSGHLPIDTRRARSGSAPSPGMAFRQGKKVLRSKMHHGQRDSDSVWNLQVALISKGFAIPHGPTDDYGRQAVAACAAFQRKQGWRGRNADGIAGPETVRRLGLVWVAS